MKDIEMKKRFQREAGFFSRDHGELYESDIHILEGTAVRTIFTQEIYQVIGHDDDGQTQSITVSCSVKKIIREFKAASKYFHRASVRNANGVELSFGTLLRYAQQQRKAAYTHLHRPFQPNIRGEC